jgi:hypothetical protein
MMRVAICCEQGAPAEMMRDAVTVGKALIKRGHNLAFIAGDPVALIEAADSWTPSQVYEAPARRVPPNLVMKPPMAGFADLMAITGFDDRATLIVLSSLWNQQLAAWKPDVLIGFYTPMLWLLGPSHGPTFALGSGLMLPPAVGGSFPRLSPNSAAAVEEGLILENANAVLRQYGQPPLAAIADLLKRCTSILYGVPAFDPYLRIRRTLSTGLLGEKPTPTVPPAKRRLAVFLDVHCPNVEQIVLAVGRIDVPVDICVSGATTGIRRFLEQQKHVRMWSNYASLLAEAANASVLVHHGVQDVAQRAISLGRPQLIIPWTNEQEILNATGHWMSFTWAKHPNVSLEEMAGTFSAILGDHSLIVAAQHHARQLANTNLPDALPGIVEKIEAATRA